ncbi:MAG: hypothetical protein MAG715_00422 [Methanonatronarchaeales archaeon]|nr:hypothetical protein [Methanonatronarchaeales archaeon]
MSKRGLERRLEDLESSTRSDGVLEVRICRNLVEEDSETGEFVTVERDSRVVKVPVYA